MEKVEKDDDWCLFCPDKSPGLADVCGEDFRNLYEKYEKEENYVKKVKAQELWFHILTSQIETGTPYLLYKDACNLKSNQSNLGVIKSSNLCTEIIEYTDKNESAVCNLASISLPSCLEYFDIKNLNLTIYSKPGCCYCEYTKLLCENLGINHIIKKHENILLSGEIPQNSGITFPRIFNNTNE